MCSRLCRLNIIFNIVHYTKNIEVESLRNSFDAIWKTVENESPNIHSYKSINY